jgi:hypothetical protein
MVGNVVQMIPAGDWCQECQALKEAHGDDFETRYSESKPFAKSVEDSRRVLNGEVLLDPKVPNHVFADAVVGTRMEVPHLAYSETEFLDAFKIPHSDIEGLGLSPVINEDKMEEDVVLLRDKTMPRRYIVYCDASSRLSQTMLKKELWDNHGVDKHKSLVNLDVMTRTLPSHAKTLDEVQTMAAQITADRRAAGNGTTPASEV